VRIPSNLLSTLLPLAAVLSGAGLPTVLQIVLAKNVLFMGLALAFGFRVVPEARRGPAWDARLARSIFAFGGWTNLNSTASLLIGNLERLLLGTALAMSAVTFYTPPQQIVNGAFLLTGSLLAVLFPAFSQMHGTQAPLDRLFRGALQGLVLATAGLAFLLAACAPEILTLWMGPEFAPSAAVLQWLSVIPLIAAVSGTFSTLLQSTRYVRAVALVSVAQLAGQSLVTWVLIRQRGLEGAAMGTVAGYLASALLLGGIASGARGARPVGLLRGRWIWSLPALAVLLVAFVLLKKALAPPPVTVLVAGLLLTGAYIALVWKYAFPPEIRDRFRNALRPVPRPLRLTESAAAEPPSQLGGDRVQSATDLDVDAGPPSPRNDTHPDG